MTDAPDPLWDGTPHWEQEPEVAEKYILYLDKNVKAGLWWQIPRLFGWSKAHSTSFSSSNRIYLSRYSSARGLFLDTNGSNHNGKWR